MSKCQAQPPQEDVEPSSEENSSDLEIEYDPENNLFEHLVEDFQNLMGNKAILRACIEKFIDNMVDEFTLGIIFDIHRKYKTNAYCLEIRDSEGKDDLEKTKGLQQTSGKNHQRFTCPNCERIVAPLGFARHLAKCMGIKDISRSLRIASRRAVTNKDKGDTSAYISIPSDDDDDDEDWNSRRNNKKKDKNGNKKIRGPPRKKTEVEALDQLNINIKGSCGEVKNFRHIMDQGRRSYVADMSKRRSNSTSSTEGGGTSTTPKKKDKAKRRSKGAMTNSRLLSFD
ncbi:SAGA-associated factor 11 homolog [Euwallacea similis]|uniref:SAGA-associated factor 11 homolog n=1 Tax=Euwallacea similis TaxID=1736056 RepID=UPI003450925C